MADNVPQHITIAQIIDVLRQYFGEAYSSIVTKQTHCDVWLLCNSDMPVNLPAPYQCFLQQAQTAGGGRNAVVDIPAYVRVNSREGQIYNTKFANTGDVLRFLETYYPFSAWHGLVEQLREQARRREEQARLEASAARVASDMLIPALRRAVDETMGGMPRDMDPAIARDVIRNTMRRYADTGVAVSRVTSQQDVVSTMTRIAALL